MSKGKKVLLPFTLVNAQSLATSFQSNPSSLELFDRCFLTISCTGTPTGTVTVQCSGNYNPNIVGPTYTWFDVPLNLNALTGSAQDYVIDIQATALPWIRIDYTAVSGTGSMTAVITAKES